ncbi:hypothetical protein ACS5NO_09400 [Larkinella sp. GY13]|uniref:hypothetical protein n=1 Tax=Larkinella sp. GY13 TaxID=3453720 RepID=UPI003EEFD5D9
MKGIITLFVLLSSLMSVTAQNPVKASFKVGLNTIFFGSGDLRGTEIYNEYNYRLSSHFTLAPSLHAGYGTRPSGGAKGTLSTDVTLFFSPMQFNQSKVRLGIGPSLRFLTDSRFSYPGDRYSPNYWTLGYTMALEGEFNLSKRWLAGVGGSIQPYESGEIVSRCGLSVGYKF